MKFKFGVLIFGVLLTTNSHADCTNSNSIIDTIRCFESNINELKRDLEAEKNKVKVPKKAVMAFELEKCPNGWEEYKNAQGRFIRGLDKKNLIDPDANRDPGSIQEDAFQGHAHGIESVTSKNHGDDTHTNQGYREGGYGLAVTRTNAPTSQSGYGDERVSTETRPKNVALLFCIKL